MDSHYITYLEWRTSFTAKEILIGPYLIGFLWIVRRGSEDIEHCVWIIITTPHGFTIEPEITIELYIKSINPTDGWNPALRIHPYGHVGEIKDRRR